MSLNSLCFSYEYWRLTKVEKVFSWQGAKAKRLLETKGLHVMDALKRDTKSHSGLP